MVSFEALQSLGAIAIPQSLRSLQDDPMSDLTAYGLMLII